MHRGKVAHALLPQIIIEQEADIVLISEQYANMTTGYWLEDETYTAAIWIPSTSHLIPNTTGKGNGFVWVRFDSITLFSCYLTPSDSIGDFQRKLDEIEDNIISIQGPIIVAGDFNARSPEWGLQTANSRGRRIIQMTARTGFTVANIGNVPTFRRPGCEGSIPDITLVSDRSVNRVKNWKVLEIYTASDHQYITYTYEEDGLSSDETTQQTRSTRRWNSKKLNAAQLISEIDRRSHIVQQHVDATTNVEKIMQAIKQACDKSMPKMAANGHQKKPVYWWNEIISNARQNCLRQRRKFTRARRRGEANSERLEYKEAKRRLQQAIFNSKKQLWEELREDLNNNPWGTGYKLVMGKLATKTPTKIMDEETMENIVMALFPKGDIPEETQYPAEHTEIREFTVDELQKAAGRLKDNKAPGPDGIPAEVIKEISRKRPEMMLSMYNKCLREGLFPEIWKKQQLVLINKGKKDPNSPSAYRPLCLLDTAGKLYESLIKPRLNEEIAARGGLSERQHGFRPKRSTISAINDVVRAAEATQTGPHSTRPVVLLATLDVKNAFNSLKWPDILRALEERFQIPYYLARVIRSYLKDRELIYSTKNGQRKIPLTSGAAQGSILGPDLWNISYDDILNIEMPQDTFLVGYADDIAAVIKARDTEEAKRKLRQVVIRTRSWLDTRGLQLAMHKTEILILTRRHIPVEMEISLGDLTLTTMKYVKYLGIRLDSKLTYSEQIKYAANKASKITGQLSRLMANIGGPIASKRKLLMEASTSILLYGCEIWGKEMTVKKRAKLVTSVQRTAALRVTSAYRTVSASAVLVIAGMIPIDLQIRQKHKFWLTKQANDTEERTADQLRQEALNSWQTRWNTDTTGRWTAKLIPNIEKWVNRGFGDVDFYLTQMLSGHGYYRKYLHRIRKCSTPFCLYENEQIVEDAEHTFFNCTRWTENRRELEGIMGPLTAENVVDTIITDEANWHAFSEYCKTILRTKKADLEAAET